MPWEDVNFYHYHYPHLPGNAEAFAVLVKVSDAERIEWYHRFWLVDHLLGSPPALTYLVNFENKFLANWHYRQQYRIAVANTRGEADKEKIWDERIWTGDAPAAAADSRR